MRRVVVKPLALGLLLAGVSIGLGQQGSRTEEAPAAVKLGDKPKVVPAKSKLEDMLAEALKNNPDIRVAIAKAAEAEAELNRTRLQVTQKVIALHHSILSQKAAVEYAQKKYERFKNLSAQGSIDARLLDEAQESLTAAKAKLAELEAQVPAVLGKTVYMGFDAEVAVDIIALGRGRWLAETSNLQLDAKKATGPMADKIREALGKPISLKISNGFVSDVFQHLQKGTDIIFKRMGDDQPEPQLSLDVTNLSLAAVLQLIEDDQPRYRFVVREYGILFGPAGQLPPGAVTVQEFMRQKPAKK